MAKTFGNNPTITNPLFSGFGGTGSIPGYPPNPFDIGVADYITAKANDFCGCDWDEPKYSNLSIANDPLSGLTFLFKNKSITQFLPNFGKGYYPISGLKNTIKYHIFDDGQLDIGLATSYVSPDADHSRTDPANEFNWTKENYRRGAEHIYGDAPNYRLGKEIVFDSGKYYLTGKKLLKFKNLDFSIQTHENTKYLKITNIENIYIKNITIVYNKDNILYSEPNVKHNTFHLFFKYNLATNNCSTDNLYNSKIKEIENIIDNISLNDGKLISKTNTYLFLDCGYVSCDYIEWIGYLPEIVSISCEYLEPQDYFDNVLISDSYSATFDANGGLYVFYQDDINWRDLPYKSVIEADNDCVAKSSSSSVSSSSSSSSSSLPGFGGNSGGGGGGAGGGGGSGGGGGIPGGNGTSVSFQQSSSSSVQTSSSSSALSSSSSTSTSSSSGDKTPPTVPVDGVIRVSTLSPTGNDSSKQNVILIWDNTDTSVNHFNIYRSINKESDYKLIGTTTSTTFTDTNPVVESWNYYKITAVDAAGNESGYLFLSIFVTKPKECKTKNCLDCDAKGFRTKNSYSVFFSEIPNQLLAFQCENCNSDNPGYITILQETFFKKELSELTIGYQTALKNPLSEGDKIPVQFCLYQSCDDTDPSSECKWTNQFYANAVIYNCKNYSCSGKLEKVLIPLTIILTQTSTGFVLEMYATSPDNKKMQIFNSLPVDFGCKIPELFLNGMTLNNLRYISTNETAGLTTNECAINPSETFKKTTGTISCAYSPDKGNTWYNFRGLVKINSLKNAIKPTVSLDPIKNQLHLFWVERDYLNSDAKGVAATTGFEAILKHVKLDPKWFNLNDTVHTYWPNPDYYDEVKDSDKASEAYNSLQLLNFTDEGKALRSAQIDIIKKQEYSSKDINTMSLLIESHSSFVDAEGKLNLMRFLDSGTYLDAPDKLTRRRIRKANCGKFIWSVAGITDEDCTCQGLIGTFYLEQDKNFFSGDKWTLQPSSDGQWWEMIHDEGTKSNSMLIFRKARTSSVCPPSGSYTLVCSRCLGQITGTLEAQRLSIYGNGALVDNSGDLPAEQYNNTDFGFVISGQSKVNEFIIRNTTNFDIEIKDVQLVGVNNNSFLYNFPGIVKVGEQKTFTITFSPKAIKGASNNVQTCSTDFNDPIGIKNATIRIITSDSTTPMYEFQIKGTCISSENTSQNQINQKTPSGNVYSADAIVNWLMSSDEGNTWVKTDYDLKGGNSGSSCYDYYSKSFFNIYVCNQMLFIRRYPATTYNTDPNIVSDSDDKFDGFNIVKPPEVILPNTDLFALGMSYTLVQLLSIPLFFDLANINIPGEVIDTFEDDPRSKKTKLENEVDPGGIAIFISGNRTGSIINAIYPYRDEYSFDERMAVANSIPVGYITRNGKLRIFYTDINGNINGALLNGIYASVDSKLKQNG